MKKLYIKTHGCQMNEYDSDKMADVLKASHDVERTNNPDEADIILLNTCSVREKPKEKVFSELGRARDIKAKRPFSPCWQREVSYPKESIFSQPTLKER